MALLSPFLTESGWIYGQAALHHPAGYIRGYPMYYPQEGGERLFRKRPYTKYVRFAEETRRPRQPYQSDPAMDPWSATISLNAVTEVIDCKKAFRSWRRMKDPRNNVIETIRKRAGISLAQIGLGGSQALRCARPDSDVDVIVYGSWNTAPCIREIENALIRKELSLMDTQTAETYARRYSILYGIPHEKLFQLFALDITKVYVASLKISFIFVYDDKEKDILPTQIYDERHLPDRLLEGRLVSGVSSWVYPRHYLVESDDGILYSAWTHHWFYKGIASPGMRVEMDASLVL